MKKLIIIILIFIGLLILLIPSILAADDFTVKQVYWSFSGPTAILDEAVTGNDFSSKNVYWSFNGPTVVLDEAAGGAVATTIWGWIVFPE